MNEPMVICFQAMALDEQTTATTLLKIAKEIAMKFELQDVSEWIDKELNEYTDTKVPNYRQIRGQLKAVPPHACPNGGTGSE